MQEEDARFVYLSCDYLHDGQLVKPRRKKKEQITNEGGLLWFHSSDAGKDFQNTCSFLI